MSKNSQPSEAIKQFRENIDNLLYADFIMGQYKAFTAIVKDTISDKNVNEILDEIIRADDKDLIYNLFFVNLVTILEVYLKDRIVEELNKYPDKVNKFLKEYKSDRKITIEDVLAGPSSLTDDLLNNIVFHNIRKTDAIYKIVLGFSITQFGDYKHLDFIINVRHKIVHHGGTINGKKIRVTPVRFIWACQEVTRYVEGIDYYCRYKKMRNKFPRVCLKHYKKWEKLFEWDKYVTASWQARPKAFLESSLKDNEIII